MNLASAYPNSDLSPGALTALILVVLGALAFWLIAVFIAAREPRKPQERQAAVDAAVATPEPIAAAGHSQADSGQAKPSVTTAA
jgi:cytoskeletal protein RodZ